jgi:hypothetical protein
MHIIVILIFIFVLFPLSLILISNFLFFFWQLMKIVFYVLVLMFFVYFIPSLMLDIFNVDFNDEVFHVVTFLISVFFAILIFIKRDSEKVSKFLRSLD